ncbi:MAG TPA: ABC transporter substrate-binding protein [Tepidisphaeraceae bacterium]|nr:ABC transporter substrate-binding protein [Tepidisphaeraceae bacterium]
MKLPLLFACAVACLVAPAARAQNEIVIGHFGSLTGGTATFGTSTKEGIDLAVKEINDAGGVLGRKIRVVHEDDQSKPTEATKAVIKLINQDNVVAVIGEVASTRSLAAAPTAQENGVPMLSPASTNPKVTQVGDYIFRSCFIDPFQGSAMANFVMKSDKGPKAKRLAVLYDVRNDYSTGLRGFFIDTVKANGGQIVADEAFAEGAFDFNAQLTKIKAANPDAIYCPGYYQEVGLICRQARKLGITVPFLGGDGWDSEKLFEIGGPDVNGCFFTNHYSPDEDRPAVKKFVEDYRKAYKNKTPDAMAILGYDAMKIMADAIRRAGSTDGKAIRDALAATKDFPAASGTITIDADRNAQKPIVVLKVEGGKTVFIDSVGAAPAKK